MVLATKYDPTQVEDKWYRRWMAQGFFEATPHPGKKPYTIVIPPPNVTGVLHMGHMLNNTIQDILIRRARMQGYEACWVPGTDHASIATEAKVVQMLREKGIRKSELSRDEFMKHAWEWKEKYGGIILEQLKKLGASCDWGRTAFTMDPAYYKAVVRVFVDLHKKGYIYRGLRMINWDCEAKTALSNEEVIHKEEGEESLLFSVRYAVKDSNEWVVIATQRPETIFGDTAIAVNPTDDRYRHLIGKLALVPFIGREIPIVGDDYVDREFGTGCLKVTPANDPNDYEIGLRHNLPVIDTLDPDGTLNARCEMPAYIGKDRFAVRKLVVKDLETAGLLVGSQAFITRIGRSERTNSVVEPRLSLQWFINMKEMSRRAYRAVMDDEVKLHPSKFKNTYAYWMKNVRDWCISRQLWWGHRIPAYYYGNGEDDFVVAESPEEALHQARAVTGNSTLSMDALRQDPDVLDTWASSWLWPTETFGGFADTCFEKETGEINLSKNKDLGYFYPTDTLVTAPEILFFWVARMIIAGYEYTGQRPFKDVYLTGIVRDKLRRKMSKSLGNSPDPLELIRDFGADGVRTGMLFSSPAGNDLLFDEKLVEQGRNFANKIWNAYRLINGWEIDSKLPGHDNEIAIRWFENRFNRTLHELEEHFDKFRISDALMTVYKLIWDDFCSWYLEMIKPAYGQPIDKPTFNATLGLFENLMKVLHPFMPFITEELWHAIKVRDEQDCVIVAPWPEKKTYDAGLLEQTGQVLEAVSQCRNARSSKGLSPKEELELLINTSRKEMYEAYIPIMQKLANLSTVSFTAHKADNATQFVIKGDEFYIPLSDKIDVEAEKEKMLQELTYTRGFLAAVIKKLGNERFVAGAPPQVVATEHQKQAGAEARIRSLEEALKSM